MSIKCRLCTCLSAAAAVAAFLALGLDASAQDTRKPARTASACKGLDQKACKAKTGECLWIAPKKGKQKAYCRLKAKKKT